MRFIKEKDSGSKINKITHGKEELTLNTTEIQRIIRDYHKQIYINKMHNLEEMHKFLKMYNLPRLNQGKIENIRTPITSN